MFVLSVLKTNMFDDFNGRGTPFKPEGVVVVVFFDLVIPGHLSMSSLFLYLIVVFDFGAWNQTEKFEIRRFFLAIPL